MALLENIHHKKHLERANLVSTHFNAPLCFIALVIAASGRQVCQRGRLACALACLACVRRFAGGLCASARQLVSSQMRYNVGGACVPFKMRTRT